MSRSRLSRARLAIVCAAAACSALAACTTALPAGDAAAACSALTAVDGLLVRYPGADPDGPPPAVDVLKGWGSEIVTPIGTVATNVPADLVAPAGRLRSAFDGVARGVPLDTRDAALQADNDALGKWGHNACGFTRLDVVAKGSTFAGVPATLPAGPVSVSFTNEAPPEQLAPVLLIGRLKDGASYTLDGIRSGAIDLHTAFDIVVAAESPADVKYANVDLRPGRHVVVSPTGAPEFTGMIIAEVDVK